MQYYGLTALLVVLALLVLAVAIARGWRLGWLLPWLKGNLFLLAVAISAVLAVAAWEMQQFRTLESGSTVATLTFRAVGPQLFEVELNGIESGRVRLNGDQWELDAQVLRWRGLGHAIGLQDGYRLHRLAGRYLALEQQQSADAPPRGLLHATPSWRDLWYWLDRSGSQALLEADAFTLRFMPMTDGARYALEIGATGLTPVPLNQAATEALKPF
ncbi:hypothetical protein [Halopseudomonas pelagia]|uniref:hypothetical protein n=1 Tax=Halopseudomonas pelagia TaxID=553151 RepID=UPI0003A2D477|nr:hypothetical protein [Halopseudomonas pelagia]|tara:strand:- start:38473 stop:39117 length:645 start_codon:yes stop_codon:yes gene_type:complete